MLKKILIGFVSLVLLLVVAALVLPFVVDFNQFKPHIKAIVSDSVRADLEFESARLTILTGLGVHLKKVQVKNTDPTFNDLTLFAVDDLNFRVDLMPLLSGKLEGFLSIKEPEINVAQKGQTNNLAALAKPSTGEPEAPAETPAAEQKPLTPEEQADRDAMIEEVKRNVVIREFKVEDAKFRLLDLTSGSEVEKVKVQNLDITIQNIGLEQDIITTIGTEIALKEAGMSVQGPLTVNLVTQVNTQGSQFEKASITGKVDLDQLAINMQNAFVKKSGIALNVGFGGSATGSSLDLSELKFRFHSVEVDGKAKIDNFEKLDTDLQMAVNAPDLQGLGEVLPQHKDMLIGGNLDLKLVVDGMLSDLALLKVFVDLNTNLTGADLRLDLDVTNAKAPVLTANVRSMELDIDRLLGPFMPKGDATPTDEAPAADAAAAPQSDGPPPQDISLTEEQKKLLAPADLNLDVALQKINYDTIDIDQLVVIAKVKDLKAELSKFGLQIFDGNIVAEGSVDLAAAPIGFTGHFAMNAIETSQMLAVIAPEHKDTLQGKANFDLQLVGSGTTVPTLSKTLNGKGTFAFLDGTINGASITEELAGKINGFIAGSSITSAADSTFNEVEKILANPLLEKAGATKSFDLQKYKTQYQGFSQVQVTDKMKADQSLKDVKGELEIKDGRVYITSAKASDAGTYDVVASVGLDTSLDGTADFKASDILKQSMTSQSKYATLMFDENGDFALPLQLGGSVASPTVGVNFDPIKQRFTANAKALVEKEVKAEADKLKDRLLKGKLDMAKQELEKKKAELQQRAAAEKAAAQKKLDDAKKKKEAEARAKANAEKDKAKDKGKDALKKKFGL